MASDLFEIPEKLQSWFEMCFGRKPNNNHLCNFNRPVSLSPMYGTVTKISVIIKYNDLFKEKTPDNKKGKPMPVFTTLFLSYVVATFLVHYQLKTSSILYAETSVFCVQKILTTTNSYPSSGEIFTAISITLLLICMPNFQSNFIVIELWICQKYFLKCCQITI